MFKIGLASLWNYFVELLDMFKQSFKANFQMLKHLFLESQSSLFLPVSAPDTLCSVFCVIYLSPHLQEEPLESNHHALPILVSPSQSKCLAHNRCLINVCKWL